MPNLKTYDLFISHAWKYGDDYENLINLLDNAPNFKFRNYSAPEDKPLKNLDSTDPQTVKEIKDAITRKIRPANVVLVIAGMYYNYRKWMQYEMDEAVRLNKPIIAIYPYGSIKMPEELSSISIANVRWNTDSIVQAIRDHSL